jgi:hypothetical protein
VYGLWDTLGQVERLPYVTDYDGPVFVHNFQSYVFQGLVKERGVD